MSKFYIKYVPPRRGLDMVEYLEDYLSSVTSSVTFQPSFYDNIATFGVLEGSGDDLSRILRASESRSAAVRLSIEEFAGAAVHAFNEYSGPDLWESNKAYNLNDFVVSSDPNNQIDNTYRCIVAGTSGDNEPIWPDKSVSIIDNTITWVLTFGPIYVPPEQRETWSSWLNRLGIVVAEDDKLDCVKHYKLHLLKEIAKKKFYDDNDSIADLSKAVMALTVHYPDFSSEQKLLVDTQINIIKQIYDKETSLRGLTELTSHLSSILGDYYAAKTEVITATTIDQINSIAYD